MNPAAQSLLGISEAIEELRKTINLVAPTNLSVLIQGETGTGKELVARAIHDSSRRARGPLIDVNCASLPESLAEAELFGHEKGAFTGADRPRKGHFEQAHGGTVFLDEVGELSPQLQPKLLRVLELREVRRIGGAYSVAVDFRLIMATHRNLEDMVRTGKFREDLYHRMNVCSIRTPAFARPDGRHSPFSSSLRRPVCASDGPGRPLFFGGCPESLSRLPVAGKCPRVAECRPPNGPYFEEGHG